MSDMRSEWERFKQAENPEFGRLSELREGSLSDRLEERKKFSVVPLLENEARNERKPPHKVSRKPTG
ncbi:hypothetical protein [Nesterenkonia sandarakina]|nr:hypothetical protein [Nesterenkonia sandarakina]